MMNVPRLIVASTVKGKANEIATNIGAEKLSNQDCFEYYLWNIQNKYYKTQVLVCTTENPSQDISVDGVEALILHHDPQAEDAEQRLEQWSPLIASLEEAEVLLFCCDCITDVAIRDKVIKWCLQRKFELIELNNPNIDALEAEMEHNKYGIERIIEALHAHMWPNLVLKGKVQNCEEQGSDMNQVEDQFENIKLTEDSKEKLLMESILDGLMGEEKADFVELFNQLIALKEHAVSLPTSQRRIAAEQLVTAFWNVMGGDPSETED